MRRRTSSHFVRTKARGIFLFYIIVVSFFIVAFRLVQVQFFNGKEYQVLAHRQYNDEVSLQPKRGSILDRSGSPLAESLTAFSVVANPYQITDAEAASEMLSPILKQPQKTLLGKMTQKGYFVWLSRKVSDEEAKKIKELKLAGVEIVTESTGRRFYPKGKLAAPLLGYTGVDEQGLDGVEYFYDKELKGEPGKIMVELDALGQTIPGGKWEMAPVVNGLHLASTIDETIQYVAERELAKAVKDTKASGGTVIVMEPKSGDILAMANITISKEDKDKSWPDSFKNRAITDAYEPGSTFKTVVVAAALDSGKVSPTEKFYCGSSLLVGGRVIHNADDGMTSPTGKEDAAGILTYSFNVGVASLGQKLGNEELYKYLDRFEFMRLTGIDLPGEGQSIIPALPDWTPLQLATISFGQGIAVTPMQLLRVYNTIANGGYLVTPHIGKALVDDRGEVQKLLSFPPPRMVISLETVKQMRSILQKVVEEGTGKKAKITGYSVAGKTGTAQVVENGNYVSGKYVASFIGFVPAEDPILAILVKVDEPTTMIWGGAVAAPVFQAVAKDALWHLRIPPTSSGGIVVKKKAE